MAGWLATRVDDDDDDVDDDDYHLCTEEERLEANQVETAISCVQVNTSFIYLFIFCK